MERYPETGINVLIVGAGIGGLTAAIECYRHGHTVRIIEKRSDFDFLGHVLQLGANALATARRSWPGFVEKIQEGAYSKIVNFYKADGSLIRSFDGLSKSNLGTSVLGPRSHAHHSLREYAASHGIAVEFGKHVVSYAEDAEQGFAVLDSGERIGADVVIAADGIGSRSSELVLGHMVTPMSSGGAIYRAKYPIEYAMRDPAVKEWLEQTTNNFSFFLGRGNHVVVERNKTYVSWLLMYKDDGNADESGEKTQDSDEALKYVKEWTPIITGLIKSTKDKKCYDWKLMFRDPNPTWVSPQGRVVQLGDAAHSFLPTSGSGASQAMEDGIYLAACLRLVGKEKTALALRVYNKLRFERASCGQKLGFKNRQVFRKTAWEENNNVGGMITGKWMYNHDPEHYVYDNYEQCADHILNGAPFKNTNIPPGYEYKPWTVPEMLKMEEAGENLREVDAGDWS